MNPFQTTKGRYLDNYASTVPVGANQGYSTPHYQAGSHPGATGQKLPTVKIPTSEIERLKKERTELV